MVPAVKTDLNHFLHFGGVIEELLGSETAIACMMQVSGEGVFHGTSASQYPHTLYVC